MCECEQLAIVGIAGAVSGRKQVSSMRSDNKQHTAVGRFQETSATQETLRATCVYVRARHREYRPCPPKAHNTRASVSTTNRLTLGEASILGIRKLNVSIAKCSGSMVQCSVSIASSLIEPVVNLLTEAPRPPQLRNTPSIMVTCAVKEIVQKLAWNHAMIHNMSF